MRTCVSVEGGARVVSVCVEVSEEEALYVKREIGSHRMECC